MNPSLDRLHIEFDVFRQAGDDKNVLVCFSSDYHSEQRHLLQSTTAPVSSESITECLTNLVSRLIEGSVFKDATPARAAPALSKER
jgi:hypothetical protein